MFYLGYVVLELDLVGLLLVDQVVALGDLLLVVLELLGSLGEKGEGLLDVLLGGSDVVVEALDCGLLVVVLIDEGLGQVLLDLVEELEDLLGVAWF